jgi:arylsulfatase A-like enzyme
VISSLNAGQQEAYQDSVQMCASVDDMLRMIVDYCDTRYGPDGWGLIFTSDQGIQNGDQGSSYVNADGLTVNAFGDGAGKTAIWDSSARVIGLIRGPQFDPATITQPTMHADWPATILDVFGLTDHHFHDTRDGRSLLRVTDSGDVAYDRMLPMFGDFKTISGASNRGWGIVDKRNRKYSQLNHDKTTGHFFYPDPNAGAVVYNGTTYHPAYEQRQITPTTGDNNTYDDALTAAIDFRFDPTTETHPAHTTASP